MLNINLFITISLSLSQSVTIPDVIYEKVIEVQERVCLVREDCELGLKSPIVTGTSGEKVSLIIIITLINNINNY